MIERENYLDSIAGLLILVMLGLHFGIISGEEHTIGPLFSFYMAWFFFKSGMFHQFDKKLTKKSIGALVKKLIVPFIVFSVYGLILELIQNTYDFHSIHKSIYSFIVQILLMGFAWCNAPLWFLLALFVARAVTMVLPFRLWWIWVLVFGSIAIIHNFMFVERYNYIGNASLAIVYYIAGCKLKNAHNSKVLVGISLFMYLVIFTFFPVFLDIRSNSTGYGNYLIAVTSSIFGIIFINYIFHNFKIPFGNIIAFVGKNAMFYLVLHWPIMMFLRNSPPLEPMSLCTSDLNVFFCDLIIGLITFAICTAACLLLNKSSKFKWILGR